MLKIVLAPWPGKPGRCLYRLGPVPDAAYSAAVADVVGAVESSLHPWAVGNRVARRAPLLLEGWSGARARYRGLVAAHAVGAKGALRVDVRDCFASISPGAVGEALAAAGASRWATERVVAQLEVLAAHGVRGLPAGPAPSAVLANAVLAAADRALIEKHMQWARWVDDLVVFGEPPDLRVAERAIAAALRASGLRLHPGKRRTAIGQEGSLRLALGQASAARLALHADPLPGTARPNPGRTSGRMAARGRRSDLCDRDR